MSAQPKLGSLVGIAVVAAVIASLLGSLLLGLAIAVFGGGNVVPAVMFAGALYTLIFGLPLLCVLGVSTASILWRQIVDRAYLALAVGMIAGVSTGAITGLVLGFTGGLLFVCMLVGRLYGVTWIRLLQTWKFSDLRDCSQGTSDA